MTTSKVFIRNKNMILSSLHIIGMLLMIEALFMVLSCSASIIAIFDTTAPATYNTEKQAITSLLISAGITLLFGFGLYLPNKKKNIVVDKRSAYLVVALVWVVFSMFGALPLTISGYVNSYTDAFFETASGFTTTGASILTDVESLPYGIALWRIMTEWIGGVGIVVIMLSIIPFVGGGGMALYSAEVAGPTKSKLSPRIKETTHILISVYLILTIIYAVCLFLAGMDCFDAICYSFTTISTGGLAPHNSSAADFSPSIQYLLILFMVMSGTNLLFFYHIIKGRFKEIRNSEEFKVYLGVIVIATLLVLAWVYKSDLGLEHSLRMALFQVVSVFTSTGLLSTDYMLWHTGAICIIILLMFSGAMSGSTTGGMKLVRVILLIKSARTNVTKSLHSNAFVPVTLDKRMVNQETLFNVFEILMLYVITYIVIFLVFIFSSVPLDEAVVSSISMCSNIGPAYGSTSTGCFAHYNAIAKWVISFVMIIARLEFITIFSLFTKSFWRR